MTQPQLSVRERAREMFDKKFFFLTGIKVTPHYAEDYKKAKILQEMCCTVEKDLKDFIDQIITLAQEEKIKEVEKIKKYWHLHFEGVGDEVERKKRKQFNEEASVYINSVIDDAIKILKQ